MVMSKTEAFEFLGFAPGTYTTEQVKSAYQKLAMKLHPDRPGGSKEAFQKLDEAYRVATEHPSTTSRYSRGGWEDWFNDLFRSAAREASYRQAQREREERQEREARKETFREGRYDYQDRTRRRRSYTKGVSCGKGQHSWVFKETSSVGGYYKCSVCGATKTKTTRAKTSSDYRDKVGRM